MRLLQDSYRRLNVGVSPCLSAKSAALCLIAQITSIILHTQDSYRLLCQRGCEPLSEYKKCSLGEAPAKALVARADWSSSNEGNTVINMFSGNEQLLENSEWMCVMCVCVSVHLCVHDGV